MAGANKNRLRLITGDLDLAHGTYKQPVVCNLNKVMHSATARAACRVMIE